MQVGSSILRSAFVVNAGIPMTSPADLFGFAAAQVRRLGGDNHG